MSRKVRPGVDRGESVRDEVFLGEGDVSATDLSTNKGVKRGADAEYIRSLDMVDDLKQMLSHPWGRRLMWGWLQNANIFSDPFKGVGQTEVTLYELGRQRWGREIYALLNSTPELFELLVKMQREQTKERT